MFISILLYVFITLITCFSVNAFTKKIKLIDTPDGDRKRHKGDISLGGGLCLLISGVVCCLIELLFSSSSLILPKELGQIFLISIIILLMGLMDDFKPLPISRRIIIQILASWIVIIITDIYIRDLGDLIGFGNIYLGKLGIPITIFMVVGVCNAFNMMDGMDGLVAMISLTAFSFLALIVGKSADLFLVFLIFNTILGTFLLFNLGLLRRRYKIFLGDSGAMWLGFVLAWLLVLMSQGEEASFKPVVALWVILIPLIDAISTFLTRLRSRKPIFSGDRNHIHHFLMRKGYRKSTILLLLLMISIISCAFAFYSTANSISETFLFFGFITIWISYYLLINYPALEE